MKVAHVIVGLGRGGAETMLFKLLGGLDRDVFDSSVVTLMDGGDLRRSVEGLGVPVHSLGLNRGRVSPRALWRLRGLARELAPDLIMGWMYHGNLAAWQMSCWAPGRPDLLWNIRHSLSDLAHESIQTRFLMKLGARMSSRPRSIVFNSSVSITQHEQLGYDTSRALMLPNGFDLDVYRPDPTAGGRLRAELGLADDSLLVGIVGRRHLQKGHEDFLRAAKLVQQKFPSAHFLMVGLGLDGADAVLTTLANQMPNPGQVHWLGQRDDMPSLMPGLDLLVLSSLSEGFPNVVGEAMSCGVPCVATRVGEVEQVVGDCGLVVAARQPAALAAAENELLAMTPSARQALGRRARNRIKDSYSLGTVIAQYAELYGAGVSPS